MDQETKNRNAYGTTFRKKWPMEQGEGRSPMPRPAGGLVVLVLLCAVAVLAAVMFTAMRLLFEFAGDAGQSGTLRFFLVLGTGFFAANLVLVLVTGFVAVAAYAERKIASLIQCRLGPMEIGPQFSVGKILPRGWYGLGTIIADPIKLLSKEDIVPTQADGLLFRIAPHLVFGATLLAFAVIPYGPDFIPARLDAGLLFLLAATSLSVLGLVMGGYASNNKWSLYGAIRSVSQVVSYEVPLTLSLLAVVLTVGSLDLVAIVENQKGWFWNWHGFSSVWLFLSAIAYGIAVLAETNRTPFDLPEAESELVSGYHTEYSGMRWSIFMLAEYANMLLVSLVGATVFFGGYYSGLPFLDDVQILGPVILFGKALFGIFVMMWLRWTLPRFRVDRVMTLCWKALVPVTAVAFVGAAMATFQTDPTLQVFWKLMILIVLWAFVREVRTGLRTGAAQ